MFSLAIVLGVFSYIIFVLGVFGLLYKNIILITTIGFLILSIIPFLKKYKFKLPILDTWSKILIGFIAFQAFVNFIGVLGPEISFDALWYHLTIPKLYLESNRIIHIPGNLLYYSDIPKSIDLIYAFALSFNNEIGAKFIHYVFGLLCVFAIYKLSTKFVSKKLSLIASLIFYSNLVVGWESISAYVDLGWTFFEIVALYQFINWIEKKNTKNIIYLAIIVGLSVCTKIVALNSIILFGLLLLIVGYLSKEKINNLVKQIVIFIGISIAVPLPWFIFSYLNTGNPFYPLFEKNIVINFKPVIGNLLSLFINSADPINPIYIIIIPLIFLVYKKFDIREKIILTYCFITLMLWYFLAQVGGSRFMLPYLPAYSLLTVIVINYIKDIKIKSYIILLVIIFSLISISYRFLANYKYIPFVLGSETKSEFLSKNLNFNFADFYDTDNYFKTHIKLSDKVLLYGFHNLYYVDFPYIDSSFVKTGDKFNYIATQNTQIPKKFSNWKLIYYNKETNVRLYALNHKLWVY